jgi:quercetin dioxygenase-like cupin family protein
MEVMVAIFYDDGCGAPATQDVDNMEKVGRLVLVFGFMELSRLPDQTTPPECPAPWWRPAVSPSLSAECHEEFQQMSIHHALSGELINIRPLGSALETARSSTLYKTQHLEVFRMVLLAGKEIPEHQVLGELTVQCLEGSVEFSIGSTRDVMRSGDLKCLAGGIPHALRAIEDCSVLVTLLLHGA